MSKKLTWLDYRRNIWETIYSYFSKTPPVENIPKGIESIHLRNTILKYFREHGLK